LPDSIAAAAVTTLNVEPGNSRVWMARLTIGVPAADSSSFWRAPTALKSWEASWFGSYDG